MSEIRVTTLKDTSGGNSSSTADINRGRAKAFCNFNGVGTVAIRGSFNVSSISDNGTGDYTVNFSNSMSDANYTLCLTSEHDSGSNFQTLLIAGDYTPVAGSTRINNLNILNAALIDTRYACVAIDS
jgi:uncharacterized alpha/beta hydrolase family protein